MQKLREMPRPEYDERVHGEISKALAELESTPTAAPQPSIWRTVMESRTARLAAAAVIVVAAILAMTFFHKTSGVVWAEVVQRLGEIKTVSYTITADIKGMQGAPEGYTTHMTQDVQVSYEQGAVRIDSALQLPGGTRRSQTYVLFEDSVAITVLPDQKKYFKVTISDEQMQKMGEENGDPVTLLKTMLKHTYTELGRRTIDGVAAWGLQVSDPKLGTKMGSFISGGMFDQTTVQLWVDQKQELPIRIYATGSSQDGRASMEMVYDRFQWDIPIEPVQLKPQIPEDYELVAQTKWEAGKEGEEIIEVLRLFVEFADGKYPPSLKTVTVVNALAPALKQKLSAKPDKELITRLMKVDMVGMMYTTLEREGKDPAYYGDRVSAATFRESRWILTRSLFLHLGTAAVLRLLDDRFGLLGCPLLRRLLGGSSAAGFRCGAGLDGRGPGAPILCHPRGFQIDPEHVPQIGVIDHTGGLLLRLSQQPFGLVADGLRDEVVHLQLAQDEEQARVLVQPRPDAVEDGGNMLAHVGPVGATALEFDLLGRGKQAAALGREQLRQALGEPALQQFL